MEVEVGRYIAGALLTGFGALGAGIGIGTLTSKYIEVKGKTTRASRPTFRASVFALGLTDALPIISLAVGLLFLFTS